MKYPVCLAVGLGWLGLGCYPTVSTAGGSALVHSHFPYAVTYQDKSTKVVLGKDWLLENYRVYHAPAGGSPALVGSSLAAVEGSPTSMEGSPASTGSSLTLARKDGYTFKYGFDFDDDDKSDATEELPYPDLVLLHRKTNARIEVSTVLLDKRLADKELRVLLNDIVDSASGTQSLFVGFGRVALGVHKRYASKLIDSSEASLGGEKGIVATIEQADVDQLQLNSKARSRRSRLFMMHMPFDYYVSGGPPGMWVAPETGAGLRPGAGPYKYRVLLLVEYSNTPEDFEAQYPDFLRLMNATHVLTDDMLLAYLAEPLAKCGNNPAPSTVSVSISPLGAAEVSETGDLDSFCTSALLASYRFAATGEKRKAEHRYDFQKPLRPAWLDVGGYQEQRVLEAPPAEPAKAAGAGEVTAPPVSVVAPVAPASAPQETPAPPSNEAAPAASPEKAAPAP